MVFPVVMYGCENWTIKKAEWQRIDAFELWCWRRSLRVPWAARRSNQSILKEISPGCSLEGLMLKLKLQYFGHLMGRADSLGKTLMLGKIEGKEKGMTEDEMASLTQWTWVWVDSGSWWWTGRPGVLRFMGSQRVRHDWVTELISHCFFKLHLPDDMWGGGSCHMLVAISFFCWVICYSLWLIFNQAVFLLLLSFKNSLCILDNGPLSDLCFANISPNLWLLFQLSWLSLFRAKVFNF